MKIEISSEKENPFMERKEMVLRISHENQPTPAKAAVQKVVAAELKTGPEHVDIRNIFSKKGLGESVARVYLWKEAKVKDLEKEAQKKAEEKPQ